MADCSLPPGSRVVAYFRDRGGGDRGDFGVWLDVPMS